MTRMPWRSENETNEESMRLDLAPEQFGFQHEGPFGDH